MTPFQIDKVPGWHTKWPLQWAAEILAEPTREGRNRILNEAPEPLRDWIRKHVEIEFERRKGSGQH